MKLGIIDTGFDYIINNVVYYAHIYESEGYILIDDDIADRVGHGTEMLRIIEKFSSEETEYVLIKLEGINDQMNIELVIEAINLAKSQDCDIICMCFSLDCDDETTDYIKNSINIDEKTVLLSANSNLFGTDIQKNYLGINVSGWRFNDRKEYWYDPELNRIVVDFTPEVICNKMGKHIFCGKSNSMACAKLSAMITNFDEKDIFYSLEKNAWRTKWDKRDFSKYKNIESHTFFDKESKKSKVYKYIYNMFIDKYRGDKENRDISNETIYGMFNVAEKELIEYVENIFDKFDIKIDITQFNREDISTIEKIYSIVSAHLEGSE